MKNKVLIACATDKRFMIHTGTMICSVAQKTNSMVTIYVLYSEQEVEKIKKLELLYDNICIELIRINKLKFNGYKISNRINEVTYFRLLLGDILPKEINKIIYLDSDLIVCEDIKKLWDINLHGKLLGAIPDVGRHTRYISSDMGISLYQKMNIPSKSLYFNAGVLIVDLKKWKEQNISNEIMEYLKTNKEYVNFHDQDGLNAILWDKWYRIDYSWNVITDFFEDFDFCSKEIGINKNYEIINFPKIIHYTGRNKPWKVECNHKYKEEYISCEFMMLKKFEQLRESPFYDV